ncbi:MAG: FxLYD domain-containing protein [Zestosphaera sp.]
MQETEKGVLRSRNHITIVLGVVCLVLLVSLVVILAHYSVVLKDKDTQIQTLINQNAQLQANITQYEMIVNSLNNQITELRNKVEYLNRTVAELEAPQLHEVNFEWDRHEPPVGQRYMRVKGTIFNSGIYTAKNVQIHVWLYNAENTLIGSQIIYLGDIPGKSYISFSIDIYYSGSCANYTYKITYE